jgi:lysozyme
LQVGLFLKKLILLLFLTIFIENDSLEILNMSEKITKASKQALELIKKFEGFCSQPYLCPANVPTIGYGATFYEDGTKVKVTDPPINEERATQLLMNVLVQYEKAVDTLTRDDITQQQFDALVCFSYNVGIQALKNSTLLKKINSNLLDPDIRTQFLRWNKAGGVILKGLTRRREAEANLYFS